MNYFKLLVIITTAVIFAIACGQTATTPSAVNSAANTNVSRQSAAPQSNSGTGTATDPSKGNRAQTETAELASAAEPDAELYAKHCMICHKDTGKGGKTTIEGKTIDAVDLTSAKMKARSNEKL